MGYDAFGLNSENMAIKTGEPPAKFTEEAISTINRQLRRLGIAIDWTREVATCRPEYYKWTQWLFFSFTRRVSLTRRRAPVNWCPSCQTVLAKSDRSSMVTVSACDSQVEPRSWTAVVHFRITDYAERTAAGLRKTGVLGGASVVTMQRNWIGIIDGSLGDLHFAPLEGEGSVKAPAGAASAADAAHKAAMPLTRTNPVPGGSAGALLPRHCLHNRPDTLFGLGTFFILAPEQIPWWTTWLPVPPRRTGQALCHLRP
jgi:hypothetical protein